MYFYRDIGIFLIITLSKTIELLILLNARINDTQKATFAGGVYTKRMKAVLSIVSEKSQTFHPLFLSKGYYTLV